MELSKWDRGVECGGRVSGGEGGMGLYFPGDELSLITATALSNETMGLGTANLG